MATAKKPVRGKVGASEVDEYLRKLDHPRKPDIEAVRSIILGASPKISEGIQWNSPSFRVGEWFATMNLRKSDVMVVLHLGAKVKDDSTAKKDVTDPNGLLEWLSSDRAIVRFADLKSIRANRKAFAAVVRQWIAHLP